MATTSSSNYSTSLAFIRNLPPSTTSETLLAYFNMRYQSSIIDAKVFRDPGTGAPSGCGMLTFLTSHDQDAMSFVTTKRFCILDGVQVDVVRFLSKKEQELVDAHAAGANDSHLRLIRPRRRIIDDRVMSRCMLFVGNLRPKITRDVLVTYFSQFGKVVQAVAKRKRSGHGYFGFVTFASEESLDAALLLDSEDDEQNEEAVHEILGVKVQARRAKKLMSPNK